MPISINLEIHFHSKTLTSPELRVELNLGIVAASLPTLRPLFSGWLESATSRFRTGGSSSRSAGGGPGGTGAGRNYAGASSNRQSRAAINKYGYRKQKEASTEADSYAMEMARDWTGHVKHTAPVISSSRSAFALDNDNSSEERILGASGGAQRGITKHIEVSVQQSRA